MIPEFHPITGTVAEEIRSAVGPGSVLSDKDSLETCAKDTSDIARMPELVVQPDTVGKVARLLQPGIKRIFDPNLILNPGKVFDWSGTTGND
jgi:FAD/FMN-containing dehydrogenase